MPVGRAYLTWRSNVSSLWHKTSMASCEVPDVCVVWVGSRGPMIWYRRELPFTIHDAVSATIPIHAPFIPFNLSTGLLDQINERKPVLYEDSKGGLRLRRSACDVHEGGAAPPRLWYRRELPFTIHESRRGVRYNTHSRAM